MLRICGLLLCWRLKLRKELWEECSGAVSLSLSYVITEVRDTDTGANDLSLAVQVWKPTSVPRQALCGKTSLNPVAEQLVIPRKIVGGPRLETTPTSSDIMHEYLYQAWTEFLRRAAMLFLVALVITSTHFSFIDDFYLFMHFEVSGTPVGLWHLLWS